MESNPTVNQPQAMGPEVKMTLKEVMVVRDGYTTLHKFLLTLPPSRQRAIAITELETSAMWAIKGLVLNDSGSTQPNESGVTGA